MKSFNELINLPLVFTYKNWKGEVGKRKVIPMNIWYGSTEYHTEEQWLMEAYDLDKQETRDFAMNDIISFKSNNIT